MRRDNGRCVVNGCKHASFVDEHHLKPRSEGGRHEPDNLLCLCAAQHRAVHPRALDHRG
ncbi:MAG: HNH endonuclease [Myxococcota bacterium]